MKPKHRILTEASGSLTSGYLIRGIQSEGHECVASDIDPRCFARSLADDFLEMPRSDAPRLWEHIEATLASSRIDVVIPSLDETLLGWAQRRDYFRQKLGVAVVVSPPESVAVCQDKWLTFGFFEQHRIPTPRTSLEQSDPLVKPRFGRGAAGVRIAEGRVDMQGMISQELLKGVEYTTDVFCDRDGEPVYIVPRRRLNVKEGKSTAGIVERQDRITEGVREICRALRFLGPINVQAFVLPDGSVRFTEINPRIAGGMALGFAATENWIGLIVRNILGGEPISPRPIRHGLEMRRYYAEVFVPDR
jgi:carbamoyl-phosphate synthase large subunit